MPICGKGVPEPRELGNSREGHTQFIQIIRFLNISKCDKSGIGKYCIYIYLFRGCPATGPKPLPTHMGLHAL